MGIKRLRADAILITSQAENAKLPFKVIGTGDKIKDMIKENIQIIHKSPSHNLDQIMQTSVKKVLEIVAESSNYDEFPKNLQEQVLRYYAEPDKVKLWSLKDEIMNSDIMESIDEFKMSLVKKYLITNDKNKNTVFSIWVSLSSLFVETSMSLFLLVGMRYFSTNLHFP